MDNQKPQANKAPTSGATMSPEAMQQMLQNQMQMMQMMMQQQQAQQQQTSPWQEATATATTETEEETEEVSYDSLITRPDDAVGATKIIEAYETGTVLDKLFYKEDGKTLLGGIPEVMQLGITGLAGSGKSVLIEEASVFTSDAGHKVLLVSAEDIFRSTTGRKDLQSRLMDKCKILNRNWTRIQKNLFVMDVMNNPELREWKKFVEVYRHIVEKEKIDTVMIDSVTMLDDYRAALKYRLLELMRINMTNGITGIFINQRSQEEFDKYGMAGGNAIAHALDGTVLVDYGRAYYGDQISEMNSGRGQEIHFMRVMDCRLTGFRRERVAIEVNSAGFVREPVPVVAQKIAEELNKTDGKEEKKSKGKAKKGEE